MALIDKLRAIADGFRASRGITEELSLDRMAELARVEIGSGDGTTSSYSIKTEEASITTNSSGQATVTFSFKPKYVFITDRNDITVSNTVYKNNGGFDFTKSLNCITCCFRNASSMIQILGNLSENTVTIVAATAAAQTISGLQLTLRAYGIEESTESEVSQSYYTGTITPDSTTGNDGDLYFKVTR